MDVDKGREQDAEALHQGLVARLLPGDAKRVTGGQVGTVSGLTIILGISQQTVQLICCDIALVRL